MAAYLFLWNPVVDPGSFTSYDKLAEATSPERPYNTPWICPSRQPKPGDEAYMKRTGRKNNGLFARGQVVGGPYQRKRDGRQCVRLIFQSMLPLGEEITGSVLQALPLSATFWNSQASGVLIKPESAQELDRLWAERVRNQLGPMPDGVSGEETIGPGTFPEGAVRRITVNAYERNPEARRICLDRHGVQCAACYMAFAERYGSVAQGFIHVHHLRPLSSVGSDYEVNARVELRPVCPNCHAVIHLRTPPYSIEEVRQMILQRTTTTAEQRPAADVAPVTVSDKPERSRLGPCR